MTHHTDKKNYLFKLYLNFNIIMDNMVKYCFLSTTMHNTKLTEAVLSFLDLWIHC